MVAEILGSTENSSSNVIVGFTRSLMTSKPPVGKYMVVKPPDGEPVEEIQERRVKLPGRGEVRIMIKKIVTYPDGRKTVTESSRVVKSD